MADGSFSLTIGGVLGVLLSGGFVWYEVGRFATPQVPATLFDERREVFAYTAGLFVGIPLAISFVLFLTSMVNYALPGAILFLALLIGGTELGQWLLLRTGFWGRHDESGPFYALGFRVAIGGIIVLAFASQYFATSTPTALGVALVLLESFAILSLEAAGALLSLRGRPGSGRVGGGPISGVIFAGVGFFLLGLGAATGVAIDFGAAAVALIGGILVYQRLRPLLSTIPPPATGPREARPPAETPYSRTDRPMNSSDGSQNRPP